MRLTLWYVSVLAGLLIVAWGGTALLLFWQLRGQLDRFSIEEIETVEGLLFFAPGGQLRLRDDYHNHPESKNVIERYVEVRSPDGTVLYRNDRLRGRALDGMPLAGEGIGGYSPRSTRLGDGERVRLVSRSHILDGHRLLIRLAHSEEPMYSRLEQLVLASLLVLPPILVAAGLAGYGLARRALSPIDEMTRRAKEITAERLSDRLPNQEVDDELGRLARVFNDTLARLEKAFEQLRRFTSDCSHEIRTPLAMMRSVGEVGLQKNGTREEYRNVVESMLEEVNRLTSLVENLLTLSRGDAGCIELHRTVVPVMAVAREAVGLFEVLLEEKSLRVVVEGDEGAAVEADSLLLRQALINVIHNAIKYSPPGETVYVRVLNGNGNRVRLEIEDYGPGIPPDDRGRVFERFYRVDKSRSRESGGAGLGLSIAKWAVEAHGGFIGVESRNGHGCKFYIDLPRFGK